MAPQVPSESEMQVEIVIDDHVSCPIDDERIRLAVVTAAIAEGFVSGNVGVRVTDDATIHAINQQHLGHDYPTDVISFDYGSADGCIEGELVVSVDTAIKKAAEVGWPASDELTLYVVHGVLHISGLDDVADADRRVMRAAEIRVMDTLGIKAIPAVDAAVDAADDERGSGSAARGLQEEQA